MRKSQIKPISTERKRLMTQRRKMMEQEFGPRHDWICQLRDDKTAEMLLGPCFGDVNGHELKKRSQGGSILDPRNVVLLCNGHNQAVEDFPNRGKRLGLVK